MNTIQVLKLMKILSWLIFIGLCIKTGAIIVTSLMGILGNTLATADLYQGLDLSELFAYSKWYFIQIISLMVVLAALKAYIFYLVIKIFNNININRPFKLIVAKLLTRMSYAALWAGIFSIFLNASLKWMNKRNITDSDLYHGSSELLFAAGIIFIIAYLFRRGIEIQSENELTI